MSEDDTLVFKRKWEVYPFLDLLMQYYFAYCEAGFVSKTIGDVIVTVGRENTVAMLDDVPL
jgi:cyclopropane-fatty-acyl-phospholipid synthase